MKTNKKFQKSKSSDSLGYEKEKKIKSVKPTTQKKKNFKKEIYDEIDEFEEIDLFGNKEEFLGDEDEIEDEDED